MHHLGVAGQGWGRTLFSNGTTLVMAGDPPTATEEQHLKANRVSQSLPCSPNFVKLLVDVYGAYFYMTMWVD